MSDVSWFNATEGTILVEGFVATAAEQSQVYFQVDDGGASDRVNITQNGSNETFSLATTNSGGNNGLSSSSNTVSPGNAFKVIGAYAQDDVVVALDGTIDPTPDTSVDLPPTDTLTTARIGDDHNGGNSVNSYISRISVWNRMLSDGRLEDKTTFLDWEYRGTMFAANDNEWPLLEAVGW